MRTAHVQSAIQRTLRVPTYKINTNRPNVSKRVKSSKIRIETYFNLISTGWVDFCNFNLLHLSDVKKVAIIISQLAHNRVAVKIQSQNDGFQGLDISVNKKLI